MKRFAAFLVLAVICIIVGPAWGADQAKEEAAARNKSGLLSLDQIDLVEITGLDLEGALAEDQADKAGSPDKSAYRVGLAASMAINTGAPGLLALEDPQGEPRGTWEEVGDGRYLWRLRVRSADAIGLSFGFTSCNLPADATLYIYSLDHTWVAGPYSSEDNNPQGQLWTPAVLGDEAVIELNIPGERIGELTLVLGSVTHVYRSAAGADKSGSCNVDVVCSSGWEEQIRSVGRYTFTEGDYTYLCSGSLINNTENDGTAYFLTANHCVSSGTVAATVVVTWDYESATCRAVGSVESGTALPLTGTSQSGASLKATNSASDFTLLLLNNAPEPSTDAFWSGWDRSGLNPDGGVCIHHPHGDAKRISHENAPLTTTSYLGTATPGDSTHFRVIDWDSGTTEGGSSGSPLFDPDGRIVGQLHGGYAACGNDLSDWYGRLVTSWTGGGSSSTRLSDWLDPAGTGATTLDGYEGAGVAIRPGFNASTLAANDDGSTGLIDIGFEVNFFGSHRTSLYVNNNGNVTFDSEQGTYTPYNLASTSREIIAPFFADVDTRNSAEVTYGQGTVDGRDAFGVNWINVGYFSSHNSPLNSFQLVIIDRSDIAAGDFDIEFNYSHIGWETGDASGGSGGFGGSSARAGYSNGSGDPGTSYELPGSAVNGALIDGGPHALISGKYNSTMLGRYVFKARNGHVQNPTGAMPWLMLLLEDD